MKIHNSHTLFASSDFTEEEIENKNVLAVAVLEDHHSICKKCGRQDHQLEMPCPRSKAWRGVNKRLNKRQIEVMKRCLGLYNDGVITKNVTTREELGADETVATVLVNKGLMRRFEPDSQALKEVAEVEPTYQVTREGIQALKLNDIKVGE